MKLFDAFGKLFSGGDEPPTELVCPRCDQPLADHDTAACDSRGMKRRVFLGLLGASSAALAMRLEGVPIPTARRPVLAASRDLLKVEHLKAPFTVVYEKAREFNGQVFRNDDGLAEGGVLKFPIGSDRIRVNSLVCELVIVRAFDDASGKDLPFRIFRAKDADMDLPPMAKVTLDGVPVDRHTLPEIHPANVPRGLQAFFRVPEHGDWVREKPTDQVFYPMAGGVARAVYRPRDGYEFVYDPHSRRHYVDPFIPASLRRLRAKYVYHPTVDRAIGRARATGPASRLAHTFAGPRGTLPV